MMDEYYDIKPLQSGETLQKLASRIDKASRRCYECELAIPDPSLVHHFLKKSGLDSRSQATLLMAGGSDYKWKTLKEAAITLYPKPSAKRVRRKRVRLELQATLRKEEL